jgi:hypothetical protein
LRFFPDAGLRRRSLPFGARRRQRFAYVLQQARMPIRNSTTGLSTRAVERLAKISIITQFLNTQD